MAGIDFPFDETRDILHAFVRAGEELIPHQDGRAFLRADGLRVEPPLLIAPARRTLARYLLDLEESTGAPDHLVLLVQAGSTALGYWRGLDLQCTKVIRRYVVRGKGRAQPLHAKTRGKSRYGSRLRLQNHALQMEETNEKLASWFEDLGPPRAIFASVPVRTWNELITARPPLPFDRDLTIPIPFHVHTPDQAELLSVHRRLTRGVIFENPSSGVETGSIEGETAAHPSPES